MSTPLRTILCSYRYDPLDRVIMRDPAAETAIEHFYCHKRLATELQGIARRSVVQHLDQLLAHREALGASVTTSLLATDQQRSILHFMSAASSQSFAYTAYGNWPASGLLSLLGFNGERPDPLTGNYLLGNGYRQFSPVLMRFLSPDYLSPFGAGGINAYAYCGGDPVNFQDLTGHARVPRVKQKAPVIPSVTPILDRQALRSTRYIKKIAFNKNATPAEAAHRRKFNISSERTNTRRLGATVVANEKKNLGQTSYTTSSYPLPWEGQDMTDVAYEFAKDGYGFKFWPDIEVAHDHWDPEIGRNRLDVMHFDAAIYKAQRFVHNNPSRGYDLLVHRARIRRAEYIWWHTGINYLDDDWWVYPMAR